MNSFLFHTGSIKRTPGQGVPADDVPAFLFHTGSIKRQFKLIITNNINRRFYSILVRLKDQHPSRTSFYSFRFYSILVRLKEYTTAQNTWNALTFLFHTGSIKRVQLVLQQSVHDRFYSILVRLKECELLMARTFRQVSIPYWFD